MMWYVWVVIGVIFGIFVVGLLASGKQEDLEMANMILREKLSKYERDQQGETGRR